MITGKDVRAAAIAKKGELNAGFSLWPGVAFSESSSIIIIIIITSFFFEALANKTQKYGTMGV